MENDQEKKGMNMKLLAAIAVAAVLVIGGGLVVLSGAGGLLNGIGDAGNANPQVTELFSAQDVVKIPLSNISSTLSFYTYKSNGTAVKFFAVKGTDGNVHVAFDTSTSAAQRDTRNLATTWCVATAVSTSRSTASERPICAAGVGQAT
jgi:hypothetical protein